MGLIGKLRASAGAYPFWGYLRVYRKRYFLGFLTLIAVDTINVVLPLMVKEAMDALHPKDFSRVLWAGVIYFALMVLQAVGRYLWRIYLIGTSHFIARDIRLKLYDHLQRLPLNYYQSVRTGDLMSRATNDIESVRMAVGPGILVTVDALLVFILIVPVMFWLSPKLSLLAFAFYPVVPFLTHYLGNKIDALFEQLQTKISNLSAMTQESFRAIRLIKSLVLEPHVESRFIGLSKDLKNQGVTLARYQAAFSPLLSLLTNLGTLLILLLGGMDVLEGAITVGTFIAFQRFVVQLSWPMEAIGWAVTMNREGVAAQRRLNEVLRIPEVSQTLVKSEQSKDGEAFLEIKDLDFSFSENSGHRFHLELRDLKIQPGQKVGLVGPVASGKTTLFNLILRLHEPAAGAILLNGRDVLSIPLKEIRQAVASVEQQVFLFSETISSNVSMGLEKNLSANDVHHAVAVACIDEEVKALEEGFNSRLGERGVNLSGGQKQRLALARALARQPGLILLDDCFSAVDVEVEKRIIENFFKLYPDLSVLFGSHRLSIMPKMDEVWLIEGGKLVDKGSHEQLLSRSLLYQELWEKSGREMERQAFEGREVEANS